jgi:hypothetical protein
VRGYDIPGVTVFVLGLTGLVFGLSRGGLNGWADPWTIGGIVAGVVLLEELRAVMHGEDERAQRRRQWHETTDPGEQLRILEAARAHTDSLLELVGRRKEELETFEAELNERRRRVAHLLRELAHR